MIEQNYTQQAMSVLSAAKDMANERGQCSCDTACILLGLMTVREGVAAKVLENANIDRTDILRLVDELAIPNVDPDRDQFYTPEAKEVLLKADDICAQMKCDQTGTEQLLMAILESPSCAAGRILSGVGTDLKRLYIDVMEVSGRMNLLSADEQKAIRGGKKVDFHTTPMLDRYAQDLTLRAARGELDPLLGRESEMRRLIQILGRRGKNNPCLIGEPGVGKTAIVEGLAQRIADGTVPEHLQNKRILTLDISGMVAGSKYRGEFEERIKGVLYEVQKNGEVILFIDEIHTIIGAGGAEGALDASNIMKPALSRGFIQVIGATTIDEYRKHIEKDAALERRFQPIMIEEPSVEETVDILKGLRSRYELHHGVTITDEGIQAAAYLSERYINDRYLPDKAIDLMDETASKVRIKGFALSSKIRDLKEKSDALYQQQCQAILDEDLALASELREERKKVERDLSYALERERKKGSRTVKSVGENEIADVVSEWTHIPLNKLTENETTRLRNMERFLHKRIIAQDEAVEAVSRAVRRGRVGLKDPKRPTGSFLFLGPTGVGKTELSKALAEAVFGTEDAMIRVDMSEYMEKHSVSKMIGSPPGYVGYDEGGQLSEQIRRHPYSVVLFDEIEKAHPDVFNILLQVLDDGHITDAQGRKTDFKNTIIIMTSNAGAMSIVEPKKLGFTSGEDKHADYERMKGQVMDEVRRIFRPEFLNRIDETIVFHSLSKDHMKKIVTLLAKDLEKRCKEQLHISLKLRDSAKKLIVEQAYDPRYGARPLKRLMQHDLEDRLAEDILSGAIKQGDIVEIGVKNGSLMFYPKQAE